MKPSPGTLALAALVAAVIVARPLVHGVPVAVAAVFWATALGEVVAPGVLLARGARLHGADTALGALGQGATLGLALHGLTFFAGRALAAPWLAPIVAVVAVLAGLLLDRRLPRPGAPAAAANPAPALLAVVLVAVLLQPLSSLARLGEAVPFDLLFHAGTAGELRHRWPLEDPRVAGVPLHYHVLAYALPIAAADHVRGAIADPLLALAPLLWLVLLALQLVNAGDALLQVSRAGVAGAAIALLHADPGELLGLGPGAFNSHFASAIYGSPTTVCSLTLLAGIVVSLSGWVAAGRRRDLAALVLLCAAASAAKTTLLPVVLCSLAVMAALEWRRGRAGEALRWLAASLAGAAAGTPFTLWQTFGASSYTRMAHLGVGTAFTSSPFASWAVDVLGPQASSGPAVVLLFLAWLIGFTALAGVGTLLWLANRTAPLTALQVWALATVVVGLLASLVVDTPDLSQLFLLYNGLLLLCLLAGGGVVTVATQPKGRSLAAALLLLAAAPSAAKLLAALPRIAEIEARSARAQTSPELREYGFALAWLRANAARDSVVFADNPSLWLSGFGEVRLYYENGLYTARARALGPGREPWPERVALQERLLRRPDAATLAQAREAIGQDARLLIVADAVQSRVEAGHVFASPGAVPRRRFFPEALFEVRFANGVMHVYEARR